MYMYPMILHVRRQLVGQQFICPGGGRPTVRDLHLLHRNGPVPVGRSSGQNRPHVHVCLSSSTHNMLATRNLKKKVRTFLVLYTCKKKFAPS